MESFWVFCLRIYDLLGNDFFGFSNFVIYKFLMLWMKEVGMVFGVRFCVIYIISIL